MRPTATIATAIVFLAAVLALAGAASAQAPYVPTPGANDLGASENDVRDEPNHPDDENGFPDEHDGEFWSPKDDSLILDAYSEARVGSPFILFTYDEDASNVRNVLMHGNNHEAYEHRIYPGQATFEAWWGYWSDTGGGGDLQQNPTTADAVNTDPNGAIDDASDCDDGQEWDEFVWRGANPCADDGEGKDVPAGNISDNMDQMFAFIQPGTHDMHVNTLVVGCACPDDATLRNNSDKGYQPDFAMGNPGGQIWRQANGFSRVGYDASFLISTQVVTSVNPKEIDRPESGAAYDPFTGATGATHAHDVDIYTSVHPAVEDAYRAAVWDPPQDYGEDSDTPLADQDNVASDLHESGLKGFAKHDFHDAWTGLQGDIFENVSQVLESTEPQQGFADDVVYGPYFHEPNTADDQYLVGNEIASHDPATSYGGLGDDYYRPGPGQTYDLYQNEEHFWMDAQVGVNDFPIWVPGCCVGYNGWAHITPEIPSTSEPIESTANEDDDNTMGPGVLYWGARAGTWHDENGDTWVGDPTGESDDPSDDPYNNGTTDDPNQYGSDEFRGSHAVNWDVKLVPTDDSDGDGTNDWGTTGVYVIEWNDANPYSDIVMDVVGPEADPVLTPLRENDNVGGTVSFVAPESGERLSEYRTEGEIDLGPVNKPALGQPTGNVYSGVGVIFPAGNFDAPFKVVTEAELTDDARRSQAPGNEDDFLEGETVLDVDHYESIQSTQ